MIKQFKLLPIYIITATILFLCVGKVGKAFRDTQERSIQIENNYQLKQVNLKRYV